MPCPCLMKCWQQTYQIVCLLHRPENPKPPRSPSPPNQDLIKEEIQLREILETFQQIELQEVKVQS